MGEEHRRRLCLVGSGWRFTSGISYYTCHLAAALADSDRVSVVLMRRLIPRRFYPGRLRVGQAVHRLEYPADVRVFDGIDWYWVPSMWRATRFLRRERPEVVILQWWTGAVLHSYLLLAYVARRIGAKIVVEFHETQDTGEARVRGAAWYLDRVGNRLLSRADAYVVHSEFDRRRVQEQFPVAGRPLVVVPHGPFDHHVAEADQPAMPGAPTDEDEGVTTVLFFGTIRPYKGLEHLVEAFGSLTDAEANRLRLVIVGETWEGWTGPLAMAARSPHRDRITVVNRYVRDEEIDDFFAATDVVVLPYTRSSASGPLHIAMAHGLPVVLTDVGGLRDGAAGYDGITWVAPSAPAELAEALRTAPELRGQTFADPRSWGDSAAAYARIVEELVPT